MSKNHNHEDRENMAKIDELVGRDRFVEVVECAALNVRQYPDGPVIDVVKNGTQLKLSKNHSDVPGWTCVISPSSGSDAYAMSHYLKEV